MICLEDENLPALDPHAADIQRLRFTVPTGERFEYWAESFSGFTSSWFTQFTALREVHLAISNDMHFWGATSGSYGICPIENVRFLDIQTGLMLTKDQVQLAEEWESQFAWRVQNMDDIDEELWSFSDYPFIEHCIEVE